MQRFLEKGLKMKLISTSGTKTAKNLNLFNYLGLNLKTVFDFRD